MNDKKLSAVLSFTIFLALMALILTPITIQFKSLAIVEDRTVIQIGTAEITSNDIIVISSLAAGSVALSQFITSLIIPQTKKVLKRKK